MLGQQEELRQMECETVYFFALREGPDTDRQEKPDLLEEIFGRRTLILFLVLLERLSLGLEDGPGMLSS